METGNMKIELHEIPIREVVKGCGGRQGHKCVANCQMFCKACNRRKGKK